MREFWVNKHWPMDPAGYVFMARALLEIGRARFGDEWTGKEYELEIPRVLEQLTSRLSDRLHARNLLRAHRPDIELEKGDSGSRFHLPTAPITAEQWDIARQISKQQFEKIKPSLDRLWAVNGAFAKQCEAGQLLTFYRATAGGEMYSIPRAWWNTESPNRFIMCQLNPSEPFSMGFAGERYAWIFVGRASLDHYLMGQPAAPTPAGIDFHLSPYLRLMLSVAGRLEITADNQPKKEALMEVLRTSWTGPVPLSANLVDAMATLMREPESQLGRARKKDKGPMG